MLGMTSGRLWSALGPPWGVLGASLQRPWCQECWKFEPQRGLQRVQETNMIISGERNLFERLKAICYIFLMFFAH